MKYKYNKQNLLDAISRLYEYIENNFDAKDERIEFFTDKLDVALDETEAEFGDAWVPRDMSILFTD